MLVVAVPKQQLDSALGQLRKEAGIPSGRNFQAPSPHLSITGLPGQAELTEHPTLPEQALPTVARLIEALEKQGTGSHGVCPQGVRGCTRATTHSARVRRCPESIARAKPLLTHPGTHAVWAGRGSLVVSVPARFHHVGGRIWGSGLTPLSWLLPRSRQRGALQICPRCAGGCGAEASSSGR